MKKYKNEESEKNKRQCPLSSVYGFKVRGDSPEGIRVTTEERIYERHEF